MVHEEATKGKKMKPIQSEEENQGLFKASGAPTSANDFNFEVGERVVHPKHGVCRVLARRMIEVCGLKQDYFILEFPKGEKLSVPVAGATTKVGVRKLADASTLDRSMDILGEKPRARRAVWSKRAEFYAKKIASGDLISLAEVLRELYQPPQGTEKSYSEKQLYTLVLDRMSREVAAAYDMSIQEAIEKLEVAMIQAHGMEPMVSLKSTVELVHARVGQAELEVIT